MNMTLFARTEVRLLLTACCVSTLLGSAAFASEQEIQLKDEDLKGAFFETEVLLDVKPGKVANEVEWSLVNLDRTPLKVDRIVSSGESLSVQVEQKEVPGRRMGFIKASFTPGLECGVIRESIRVYFVGYKKPVELVVEASVAAPMELTSTDLK